MWESSATKSARHGSWRHGVIIRGALDLDKYDVDDVDGKRCNGLFGHLFWRSRIVWYPARLEIEVRRSRVGTCDGKKTLAAARRQWRSPKVEL